MGRILNWLYVSTYFERLIYYFFITELIVRIVFEFGLGEWWFAMAGTRLLIFYGIVSLDIIIWLLKGRFIVCAKDPVSIIAVALFVIILVHGAVLGVLSANSPKRMIIDTMPLILILISLMRFAVMAPLQLDTIFDRVFKYTLITMGVLIIFGIAGTQLDLPMKVAPPGSIIALSNACYGAQIAFGQAFKKLAWTSVVFWICILLSIEDINRSTMAVAALTFVTSAFLRLRFDRLGGGCALMCILLAPFALYSILPDGSKTQIRIEAIFDNDPKADNVSLNSRVYEGQQVALRLKEKGAASELIGLGHGGVYDYFVYGDYQPGHGHAHYGSALFNLRYGAIGQIYIFIMGGLLAFLFGHSVLYGKNRITLMAGFLCAACFVYLFTYAAFFLYLFGLPLLIASPVIRYWVGTEFRAEIS